MPWSEWITPAPDPISVIYVRGVSGKKFTVEREDSLALAINDLRDSMKLGVADPDTSYTSLLFNQTLSEWAGTSEIGGDKVPPPGYRVVGDLTQRDYWVSVTKRFESIGGIGNVRNWFPAEMNDLEYGVDYGPRPDRDEMEDDDAYVEYEPGFDSSRVGWIGTAQLAWYNSEPVDEPVQGELRLEAGWSAPTLPVDMPGDAGEFWWSDTDPGTGLPVGGTTLGGFSGTGTDTPDGLTVFSGSLPDQDEFAIVLLTPVFPPEALPDFPEGYSWLRQQAVKADVGVEALVQYPRFRYWIPRELPLQQRQRRDGLGISSTPAWTGGRHRQTSNRWHANY